MQLPYYPYYSLATNLPHRPCLMAGYHLCDYCGDLKKSVCRKAPCKAAAAEAPR